MGAARLGNSALMKAGSTTFPIAAPASATSEKRMNNCHESVTTRRTKPALESAAAITSAPTAPVAAVNRFATSPTKAKQKPGREVRSPAAAGLSRNAALSSFKIGPTEVAAGRRVTAITTEATTISATTAGLRHAGGFPNLENSGCGLAGAPLLNGPPSHLQSSNKKTKRTQRKRWATQSACLPLRWRSGPAT